MERRKNGIAQGQLAIDKFIQGCRAAGNQTLHLSKLFSSGEVDANAVSDDGKTILTVAVLRRNLLAISLLLEFGADPELTSHVYYHRDHITPNIWSYDETPLLTAARLNNAAAVEILLRHDADVNRQNECRPPQGTEKIRDRSALHFAAECGNANLVELLLRNNCTVNVTDKQGELPIHLAVRCSSKLCGGQTRIIEMLHQHGSHINVTNKISCVPLYLAAFYNCVKKTEMLIGFGADVNHCCERDNSYMTALHIAACKDRTQLAKLMLENGAKLNLVNFMGYTPLQLNINNLSRSDIASLLIYHGADVTLNDRFGLTLMGSLIRNLRIDCEHLAHLMVFAGYQLNRDLWLVPSHLQDSWADPDREDKCTPVDVPIPAGRVELLCDWLRERQINALGLAEICRIVIRRFIVREVTGDRSIVDCITRLPLPNALKQYLLLKDVPPPYFLRTG